MNDVAAEQRQAERVRTYFDREAADYDQGFATRPRYRDPVRRLTYRWNRRAIHGRLEDLADRFELVPAREVATRWRSARPARVAGT